MINLWEKNFIISLSEKDFNKILNTKIKEDIFCINIDWAKVKNISELFECFSNIIWFPDYFWNNWDAFWDIMTDDYFINRDIVIFLKNIDNLLIDNYEDKKIFLKELVYLLSVKYLEKKVQIFIKKDDGSL